LVDQFVVNFFIAIITNHRIKGEMIIVIVQWN